jgi:DNA-binding NarL/FixJ family response regulator
VLAAGAAALLSLVDQARGAMSSAREYRTRAAEGIDVLSNRELTDRLVALLYLAYAEAEMGEYTQAIEHGERGLAIARATGQALLVVPMSFPTGWSQLRLGQLHRAVATAEAMLDASRLLGLEQFIVWGWTLYARALVHRGHLARAIAAAEKAVEQTTAHPHSINARLPQRILGEAWICAGQPGRGRDYLIEHSGGGELPLVEVGSRAGWYETLTGAELALGRKGAARAWARRSEEAAERADLPAQRAASRLACAAVLHADGDDGGAASAARAAVDDFTAEGIRVDAARALTMLGRTLARAGDRADSVAALEAAFQESDACGAERVRDDAARELRRLTNRAPGRRGRRDARHGLGSLTRREQEVAELVARGITNKQIGAALFLSERTVEHHVAHICRKLGVTSRAAVAREIGKAAETAR